MIEPTNERVTLAVLRNDLTHLSNSVTALRADILSMAMDTGAWRKEHDLSLATLDVELHRIQAQMTVIRWLGGVLTTIMVAVAIGFAGKFFGL